MPESLDRITVLTPQITDRMNHDISKGVSEPYIYFAFNEEEYLEFATWIQSVLNHSLKLQKILISTRKYYKEQKHDIEEETKELVEKE